MTENHKGSIYLELQPLSPSPLSSSPGGSEDDALLLDAGSIPERILVVLFQNGMIDKINGHLQGALRCTESLLDLYETTFIERDHFRLLAEACVSVEKGIEELKDYAAIITGVKDGRSYREAQRAAGSELRAHLAMIREAANVAERSGAARVILTL